MRIKTATPTRKTLTDHSPENNTFAMKTRLIMLVMMLATLTLASCNKNAFSDPEGTVTVNLRNDAYATTIQGSYAIKVNKANNLEPYDSYGIPTIVSVGSGNSLSSININQLPSSGWAKESAAIVGNLYIVKYSDTFCVGVQVVSELTGTSSNILGYTVKYCPFTPGKGWNQ